MNEEHRIFKSKKKIALVAHDNRKEDLIDWAKYNKKALTEHKIFATGTTGKLIREQLGLDVKQYQSGPLGGDQQIGAAIVKGKIDFLVFFWDPLEQQPHDPDVKALLRIAVVWNIPIACNRTSADFMFTSYLMHEDYTPLMEDFNKYVNREIKGL